MSKKLIYLVSFVFVLSLTLMGTARAELVAWWRFDEGSGTQALDSSGYGNDGVVEAALTLVGKVCQSPHWAGRLLA